jgi:hypothetical protein
MEAQDRLAYVRIAAKSALAAALCLGLPAGLLLWLILVQQFVHADAVQQAIAFLQAHGLYSIYILVVNSILWSYLLGRISGYRPWWWIMIATAAGILAAWCSPLANVDGILYDRWPDMPIHLNYAASMAGLVGGVTLFVGLAYGLVLRSLKAALTMGLTTSLVSVVAILTTIFLFDQFGIRVGGAVPLAMSKVTVTGLLTSAITGGAILGVGFTKYHFTSNGRSWQQASAEEGKETGIH